MFTSQEYVLSVIELITKFVGALSFDVELPSSFELVFSHPVNATVNTNATKIVAFFNKCFIKSSYDFIFFSRKYVGRFTLSTISGAVRHQPNIYSLVPYFCGYLFIFFPE
jgi:hypothetical protein